MLYYWLGNFWIRAEPRTYRETARTVREIEKKNEMVTKLSLAGEVMLPTRRRPRINELQFERREIIYNIFILFVSRSTKNPTDIGPVTQRLEQLAMCVASMLVYERHSIGIGLLITLTIFMLNRPLKVSHQALAKCIKFMTIIETRRAKNEPAKLSTFASSCAREKENFKDSKWRDKGLVCVNLD